MVLSRFAENTNLNNHDNTVPAAKRLAHLCVGWFQYSQVRGSKTGGRIPCGGPTCFASLFRSLYRTDLLVYPTETMRSLAGNLKLQPRGRLNTSFTFVPTITNTTPRKNEMQGKFLPVQKKIYAAPTPPQCGIKVAEKAALPPPNPSITCSDAMRRRSEAAML